MKIELTEGDAREVVKRLRDHGYMRHVAAHIEAQLPKPKPEEPRGIGAVVRDDCGDLWIKVDWQWWCSTACGQSFVHFADIDQPAILSEGVEV